MAKGLVPSGAPHVEHSGRLGAIGAAESNGACPSSAIPFVIQAIVTATATTETVIPVGAGNHDVRVIDAWLYCTADGGAAEDLDVRTAAGNAGGNVIITFLADAATTVDGTRLAPEAGAGSAGTYVVDRTTLDLDSADGIFVDKTEANAGTFAGTIYFLCVRV